ncbi:hypothetical protein M406DRAFT_339923 [Cryphonectria parasitica EP155]|uniref:Efflux pump dotC n=1 Tax=Cryphonectria parasitica (strain ATCC 38755 / EP155) TaxID=660469 RepID=A0A9P4Y0G0_CRYP1|nr:uncharacterized protein M406DRAFT_339923 [Cryphonectria parasitica EP155]KAF3764281.1 hypothetical protein M406DRAFT_339923 [Cryphonectria parasitica EP155]
MAAGHTTSASRSSGATVDQEKKLPTTSDSDSLSSASYESLVAMNATRGSNAQGGSAQGMKKKTTTSAAGDPESTAAAAAESQDPQKPGAAPEDQRTKLQTAMIVAALCSAVFLAALDVTITTVAIPTISADFNSSAGYTWIGSAYLLANAAAAPSWGKISDIFGRKPVLLAAVSVFWIGSLICGLSHNMAMLITGRAIQGIGGGGSLILVNICISDMFSVRKRGVYLGFVGLVWAVAGGFGPVLGGVFTTKATWKWCFYINLPVAGLALVILYCTLKVHNPRTPIKQGLAAVDWLGSLTIVGGTLMFLLGLELAGGTYKWQSATVICLLVFGVVIASTCVLVEVYVAKYPIIPVRIFKDPRNLALLGLCACHGFVFISVSYYMPLYFQGVLGANALLSGVYVLPFTFVLGCMSALAGFVIKKTGKYLPPIIGGFALMTLGYGLLIDLDDYPNWPKIILFQIVLGLGVGPNFQSPLIALQSAVQPREIASATGTYMFVRQLSTSISIVVGGVLFDNAMEKQYTTLKNELGQQTADLLTGDNAASSVGQVAALSEPARGIAQAAYWQALQKMFIFYVAFAGLGLIISFFVGGRTLSKEHTEHKTGLTTLQPSKKRADDEEKRTVDEGHISAR